MNKCATVYAIADMAVPFGVRGEVTADNTSIRVSWELSRQGVPICVDLVRVDYQPEGGSLMMYTVDNTTATSATLLNLQCNTKYTLWVYAHVGDTGGKSASRMTSLPPRGMQLHFIWHAVYCTCICTIASPQPLPFPLMSRLCS